MGAPSHRYNANNKCDAKWIFLCCMFVLELELVLEPVLCCMFDLELGLSATKGISDQKLCEPNQRAGGDDGRCAGDKNADSNKEPRRSLFAD